MIPGASQADESSTERDDVFSDIFRKHTAVMLLVDVDTGRILDANEAAEKFYGYSHAQLKGMNMAEINLLPPEQARAEVMRPASGERRPLVFPHQLANGDIRTVEVQILPIRFNGRLAMFAIIHDVTDRKNAEEALAASEAELRSLLASMQDVVLVIDKDGIYREIAPTNPDLLYKPSHELLGRNLREVFPDEQARHFVATVQNVVDTREPAEIEYSLLIDDRTFWFEATISPLGEDRTLWVARNVTERRRMKDALRESEERYRSLFNTMMDGVYRSTHEGRFVDVNPAMARMFGFASVEEMLQVDIKNELYFSPEERGSHILDTGQKQVEVYRMRRKDGSEIWVEDHGHYIHDEQGNVIYHEGLLRDVTERVRAEQAIRESENFLRETQVIAGLGTYVLDFVTGMWRSSNALDNILGIDETYERTVDGWAALIHPQDRDDMVHYFTDVVVGGRDPFDREYKIIRKNDGAERWVHGKGALEEDADGNLLRMKGTIQDVTERRRMEDFLRQRLVELEALYNISASLQAAESFSETLPILLDQTLAAIGTDTGAILLHDANRNQLKSITSRGWFDEIRDFNVKVGEGVAGTVFVTGQPHISTEFVQDPLPHSSIRSRIPAGWGGACLPIRAGSEIVGVLFIAVKLPHQITPQQLKLLYSLAEIAGAALHRVRLHDETASRAREFESLYETSMAFTGQLDLNSLLQLIVETAKKLLNTSSSGIYLFDDAANELLWITDTHSYVHIGSRLKMGEGAAGYAAQTRKPLRIDDYSTWEGRSPQYEKTGFHAVMDVPMLYGGELIGVLAVDEIGDSTRTFTEDDERLLTLLASLAAGAIHSTRLRQEAIQRLEQMQTLRVIDKVIASSLDLKITLNILLDHVIQLQGVDAADVLLLHPYEQTLQYVAGRGFFTQMIETANVHLNDGYAGRSVMERRRLEISDPSLIMDNPPFAELWAQEKFHSYICVPLIVKGEVKGVMEIYFRSIFKPAGEWFEFLETLASQAAITIDNVQMFDSIQQVNMEMAIAYEATIEGWAHALDLRSREAQGYTQRVADLTLMLARSMGIRDNDLQHLRRGVLLHDIGKMGISDRILFKKGKLTAQEEQEMRKHPELAYQLLYPIHYLRPALDIPYCHHEKWDGSGYPRGLKGEQIPLAARIFAVADAWDALVSPRPDRKAWTKKRALSYLKQQSGKRFDPQVVDVFMRLIDNS